MVEFAQVRDAANRLPSASGKDRLRIIGAGRSRRRRVASKEVAFELFGGDVRLDAHVLAALRYALLHVGPKSSAHALSSG